MTEAVAAVIDEHGDAGAIETVGRILDDVGAGAGAVVVVEFGELGQGRLDPLHDVLVRQGRDLADRQFDDQAVDRVQGGLDSRLVIAADLNRIGEQLDVRVKEHVGGDDWFAGLGACTSGGRDDGPFGHHAGHQIRMQLPSLLDRQHAAQHARVSECGGIDPICGDRGEECIVAHVVQKLKAGGVALLSFCGRHRAFELDHDATGNAAPPSAERLSQLAGVLSRGNGGAALPFDQAECRGGLAACGAENDE